MNFIAVLVLDVHKRESERLSSSGARFPDISMDRGPEIFSLFIYTKNRYFPYLQKIRFNIYWNVRLA